MTENALVPQEEIALDAYGDRQRIRELSDRMLIMLPSVKQLGRAGAMALAQASIAMGLNPFIGELWAIPQRGGTYAIMVGIKGIRHKAHDQARDDRGMFTVSFRSPREDEIEGWQRNKGDIVRVCDLTVSGDRAERHRKLTGEVPRYTGIGIYKNGESTKMQPLQVARKRAEADAIKQAFDVPLSFVYGGASDDVPTDMPERYEEHGSGLVNGSATAATDELFDGYGGDSYETQTEAPPDIDYDGHPLAGDYRGASMDADAYEDFKDEMDRNLPRDLEPASLDALVGNPPTEGDWSEFYARCRSELRYKNSHHASAAKDQAWNVPAEDRPSWADLWAYMVQHQVEAGRLDGVTGQVAEPVEA